MSFRDKIGNVMNFRTLLSGSYVNITNNTDDITLATNGTRNNIANTLVARDGSGSFAAQDVEVDGNFVINTNPSTATLGNITKGGSRFINNFGTNNTFIGLNSGNYTMTGTNNTTLGIGALENVAGGSNNSAIGPNALNSLTNGMIIQLLELIRWVL